VRQRHTGSDFAHQVTAALAGTIRRRAGTLLLGTEVLELRLAENGGLSVETSQGPFHANFLLAAPGHEGERRGSTYRLSSKSLTYSP